MFIIRSIQFEILPDDSGFSQASFAAIIIEKGKLKINHSDIKEFTIEQIETFLPLMILTKDVK